ncbi:MAG: Rieske (2Fe-2S) protein [bacterium]|nr:Rieske (2Fe-2S) protein [bacterium]
METLEPEPQGGEGTYCVASPAADIKEGILYCRSVGGKKIMLTRYKGVCVAYDNRCTHAGGPLCAGKIVEGSVECPWHGARYDLADGKAVKLPAQMDMRAYAVRERNGNIEVRI